MTESRDEYQVLFESAPDLLYTHDISGQVTRVNRTFERVTGTSRLDLVGSPVTDLIVPEHREVYTQRVLEKVGGAPSHPFEVELITPASSVPVEISIELIFRDGIPAG